MGEIVPKDVKQILAANGAEFIDQVYRAFLRRSPDRDGRDHYMDRLRAGDGKEAILLDLADSPEARALPCQVSGMELLRAGFAPKSVNEVLAANGSDFVDQVYRAVLHRSPDASGRNHFLSRLRAGDGKEAVLVALADSPEARALAVKLSGLKELREHNCRKPRDGNGEIRKIGRVINRIECALGEMQAGTEAAISGMLNRINLIEASFAMLTSAGVSYSGDAGFPATGVSGASVRRPIKETVREVTSCEPSGLIAELRGAVRKSSEAAKFASSIS